MGGKRKKSNNGPLKKESKYKIPTRFDCPVCDTKSSVNVKIQRSLGKAEVYCRECQVGKGRTWSILRLEKGVDVFFRFREQLMKADREYLEQQQQLDTRVDPNKGYSSLLTTVLDTEAEGYDQASEVPAPTATTTKRLPLAVPVVPGAGLSSLSLKRPQIKTNSQSAAMDEADELIEGGTHFLQSERPEDVEEFEDMFA